MSCLQVRKLLSPFLDGCLAGEQRDSVLQHLASCQECGANLASLGDSRNRLRALKSRRVPERLAAELRVLASHARQRQLAGGSVQAALRGWMDRFQLAMANMMRPVALPIAGGVLSALVMFSMLVPTLNFHHNFRDDVPILAGISYTTPILEEVSPFCNGTEDSTLELTIDERGQISDYRVSEGIMTKELANDLLFTHFSPATFLGQPIPGKFILGFRRGRTIVVKG
jgi:hypothetical protein